MLDHLSYLKRNKINYYVSQEKIEDNAILSAKILSNSINLSNSSNLSFAMTNRSNLNYNNSIIDDNDNPDDINNDLDKLKQSITSNNMNEKKINKEKCGLCLHYYSKSSVIFRVPNNRIINLLKDWNIVNKGIRYQSPSYLYSFKKVCVFCSQFFMSDDDNDNNEVDTHNLSMQLDRSIISEFSDHRVSYLNKLTNQLSILSSKPITSISEKSTTNQASLNDIIDSTNHNFTNTIKYNKNTKIVRSDIACNQYCYQSSTSDNYPATNAVTIPYSIPSKTRREVDPWWEINLGLYRHIISIDIVFQCCNRQLFDLSIMLFDEPIGYNDPFYDSVLNKSNVNININKTASTTEEKFHWDLPLNSNAKAIRIQMKGIHTLCIKEFHAYQGDSLPSIESTNLSTTDSYFLSLSPSDLKNRLSSMISPIRRRNQVHSFGSNQIFKPKFNYVNDFVSHISQRYEVMIAWLSKVKLYCYSFLVPEIQALYKIIFLHIIENSYQNKSYQIFEDKDLMDDALLQNEPKAPFQLIIDRLRQILRWIQSRRHVQTLGPLTYNEYLNAFSKDSEDILYKLQIEFRKIERHVLESSHSNRSNHSKSQDQIMNGCTWSQFIIVMSLLCSNQTNRIPAVAFGIGEDTSNAEPVVARNNNTTEVIISTPITNHRSSIVAASTTFLTGTLETNDASRPNSESNANNINNAPILTKKKSAITQVHLRNKISKKSRLTLIDENDSNEVTSSETTSDANNSPSNILSSNTINIFNDNKTIDDVFDLNNDPKSNSTNIQSTSYSNKPASSKSITRPYTTSHITNSIKNSHSSNNKEINNKIIVSTNSTINLIPVSPLSSRIKRRDKLSQIKLSTIKSKLNKDMVYPKQLYHNFTTLTDYYKQSHTPKTANTINVTSSYSSDSIDIDKQSTSKLDVTTEINNSSSNVLTEGSMGSPSYSLHSQSLHSVSQVDLVDDKILHTTMSQSNHLASTNVSYNILDDEMIDGNIKSNDVIVMSIVKICVLCRLKYPKEATCRVLAKHVTNLRNYLKLHNSHSDALVQSLSIDDDELSINTIDNHNNKQSLNDDNKIIEEEQDIAMYNLVRVCLFCSQFFDPEFEEGFGFPKIEAPKIRKAGILAAIASTTNQKELLPFIDLRYQTQTKDPLLQSLSYKQKDVRSIKSREFAKRATLFSKNLNNTS